MKVNCDHESLFRTSIYNLIYECRDCGEEFIAEKSVNNENQ